MMQHRLRINKLPGIAIRGSVIDCPFKNDCFDLVISIGCFHHTGNVKSCVDETYQILKPGGKAIIMVYNQLSYRQWYKWPRETCLAFLRDIGFWKETNKRQHGTTKGL